MADAREAKIALEEHRSSLINRKNVVGTGIQDAPDGDGVVIAVYVQKKIALKDLAAEDIIPTSVKTNQKGISIAIPVKVFDVGGAFILEGPGG